MPTFPNNLTPRTQLDQHWHGQDKDWQRMGNAGEWVFDPNEDAPRPRSMTPPPPYPSDENKRSWLIVADEPSEMQVERWTREYWRMD